MVQIKNPVIEYLQARVEEAGSQKAVADEMEITPSHLSDVLSGKRNLGEEQLKKLGYTKVIVHVKTDAVAGILQAIETAQAATKPTKTK